MSSSQNQFHLHIDKVSELLFHYHKLVRLFGVREVILSFDQLNYYFIL